MKVGNIAELPSEKSSKSFGAVLGNVEILRDDFIPLTSDKVGCRHMMAGYTVVYPRCRTAGHSHEEDETEEVYFIVKGKGKIVIDKEEDDVLPGDVVYIPPHSFHQSRNTGSIPLEYFWVASPPPGKR